MDATLLVLVLVVPLGAVLPLVVGLLAWWALRPADDEPLARARSRRTSGTAAAAATAAAVVLLLPAAALLARGVPELAAVLVLLAGVLYVAVLWCGEALAARPHGARRTALLLPAPRRRRRTALAVVLAGSAAGLLGLLALGALEVPLPGGTTVPPNVTLLVCLPAVLLTALVVLAVRQVDRRGSDAHLAPEVDAGARARATQRVLRAGAAGTCAGLGLVLLVTAQGGDRPGDPASTAVAVLGGVLLVLAAVASLLPLPALPMRPDAGSETAGVVDAGAGAV